MDNAHLTSEEKYIVSESPDLMASQPWVGKVLRVFPALANRNFRLYFIGQLISLIGTWLQVVAEGWLVFQITNSAFYVGVVAAMATAPTLFLSLFGGVIVDRIQKKKILLFTQSSSMILALIYGLLAVFQLINIGEIMVLAFLLGVVNALDAPARQAYIGEMVEREELASAIALQAGTWNGARVIGPSIAGFLIAFVGVGGAFLINGVSYIAVLAALILMKVAVLEVPRVHLHPLRAIHEGVSYAFSHKTIKSFLAFSAVVSAFGWSYSTMMPVVAQNTFNVGAGGLGQMYAASGVGALFSTILISAYGRKVSPFLFVVGGGLLFSVSLILFTMTSNFFLALVFLFLLGFGILLVFPTINSTIQHIVEDKYRGRVMSIYTLTFLGLFPVGNFEIGLVSEHFGTAFAMRLGALIVIAATIFFYKAGRNLKNEGTPF